MTKEEATTETAETTELGNFHTNVESIVERVGGMEEFASVAGIKFWTVRDWLRFKKTDPRLSTVLKVSRAFKVNLDQLVEGVID